jgi:hypothetical protein
MAYPGSFAGRLHADCRTRRPKRKTESRHEIEDEAYISIPQADARHMGVFMSNQSGAITEHEWISADNRFG